MNTRADVLNGPQPLPRVAPPSSQLAYNPLDVYQYIPPINASYWTYVHNLAINSINQEFKHESPNFSCLDQHVHLFSHGFSRGPGRGAGGAAGASFLTDNILGLVIDYDELRTGTRSEATFTMFASFIPKVLGDGDMG